MKRTDPAAKTCWHEVHGDEALHRPGFPAGFLGNCWLFLGTAAMIVAQVLFTYAPAFNWLCHTAPIGIEAWIRIAAVVFVVVELEKGLRYGRAGMDRALPE